MNRFWKCLVLGCPEGWLGAGLRDGCGICRDVLVAREWVAGARGGMRGRRLGGCSFGCVCSGYFGLVLGCLGLAEK